MRENKLFQLKFKYANDMANTLNYNKLNNFFYISVSAEDINNQTWFDDSFKFPEDINGAIDLGLFRKTYKDCSE